MWEKVQVDNLKFEYKLNYEESYAAFYLLCMKWGKRKRSILAALLTVIAIAMLAAYWFDSRKIHFFFIAVLAILLLYYLIYVPVLKAKKGAKKVYRQDGIYKVELTCDGKIRTEDECLELKGDKDARAVETNSIFVIRPDRVHTFCFPKRIMTDVEIQQVRTILKTIKYTMEK